MGDTCGAGTVHPSGAPEFISGFSGVHATRSLVFCLMFCRSLFSFDHCVVCPSIYGFFALKTKINKYSVSSLKEKVIT